MIDTEDKLAWCKQYGVKAELAFAAGRMLDVGLATYVNPLKNRDVFTHDLFTIFPSDLKTVRTPLFKAKELYGLDPQYTVTFNHKDAVRYRDIYPNIVVIFDVRWDEANCKKQIGSDHYQVHPMHVTYAGFLSDIRNAIKASGNKQIEYARRRDDSSGNAKASYVFDIRHLHKIG